MTTTYDSRWITCRDWIFNGRASAFPIAELCVLRSTGELMHEPEPRFDAQLR
jgi:hypothetical protein